MTHREVTNRLLMLMKPESFGVIFGTGQWNTEEMLVVLTGIIAEDLYQHLHQSSLLPDEQKGCRKESRGTKDQLVI
ncbi:unnamed protein product, partial [Porites lobata]